MGAQISDGHGASTGNQPHRQAPKSAFVTGTCVMFTTGNRRQFPGEIVGPDQDYYPSPDEVLVSFPVTGCTLLLPVTDLEIALPTVTGDGA